MSDERDIFEAALDIDDDQQREAYLCRACRGNAELRSRIERLLAFDADGSSFLSDAKLPCGRFEDGENDSLVGAVLGRYKLIRELGEGGFGLVYLAKQFSPVRRQVAVKVIKPGMDTRQVLARFNNERQTLALMEHPSIAKVLDGGSTANGRPYFVMEAVDGEAIAAHSDKHRLNITERLLLFLKVCRAVLHAHQKGVIHRDIKPSNVLVTFDGREHVPHVIDFGVAKALAAESPEGDSATRDGQLIGTPGYMSPEQAQGQDADTRSDVYSLGVLLYELLSGQTPQRVGADRKASIEAFRGTQRATPPTPSSRFNSDDEKAVIAERRSTNASALMGNLRGDLDWIIMKAIADDPNLRFQSVAEFADDIDRYLNQLPVNAGPPTLMYRTRKYVRRHRWWLGAMSAIAVSLIVATFVSLSGWREAVRQTNLADENVIKADAAAKEAQALVQVLFGLLRQMEVENAEDYRVSQMFDNLSSDLNRILPDLKERPVVAANVHRFLAVGYDKLGRQLERFEHLRRALALLEPVHRETDSEIAKLCTQISWCAQMNERHGEGLPYAERAVSIYEALGDQSTPAAHALNALSNCLSFAGRHEEAEEFGRRALALRSHDRYKDSLTLSKLKWHQSSVARRAGRIERALRLSMDALRIRLMHYPEHHHEVAAARYSLAQSYFRMGLQTNDSKLLDDAEREFLAALKVLEDVYTYYTFQVGTARYEYFELLRTRAKYDQIITYFGEDHPQQPRDLMLDYFVLATYLDTGDYDAASSYLKSNSHLSGSSDVGGLPAHSLHFLRVYLAYWTAERCSKQIEHELCLRAEQLASDTRSPLKMAMRLWTTCLLTDATVDQLQIDKIRDDIRSEPHPSARGFALLLLGECYGKAGERHEAFHTARRAWSETPSTDVFCRLQILRCLASSSQSTVERSQVLGMISAELATLNSKENVFGRTCDKLKYLSDDLQTE